MCKVFLSGGFGLTMLAIWLAPGVLQAGGCNVGGCQSSCNSGYGGAYATCGSAGTASCYSNYGGAGYGPGQCGDTSLAGCPDGQCPGVVIRSVEDPRPVAPGIGAPPPPLRVPAPPPPPSPPPADEKRATRLDGQDRQIFDVVMFRKNGTTETAASPTTSVLSNVQASAMQLTLPIEGRIWTKSRPPVDETKLVTLPRLRESLRR